MKDNIKEGYKDSALGLIPDSWEVVKIKNIADVTAGGTPKTKIKEYWNGDIPWMNSGDINRRRIQTVKGRITNLGLKNSSTKLIPKGSIFIALAGQGKTRGKVAINEFDLCINQSLAALFNIKVNNEFLFQNLESRYQEIRKMSTGDGGRGGLNLAIINTISIKLPPKEEQKKIAEILSTIDKKIDIVEQQIKETKELKKGLMQKLLVKGIGHTKFKDSPLGQIPHSWEVVKVGDVLKSSKSGLSRRLSIQDIGIPVIRSNNLKSNKILFENFKYWYANDPQGSQVSEYYLKNGDILINFINSVSQIGKSAIYNNEIGRNVIFTTNILKLSIKGNCLNSFFSYFTQTKFYDVQIQLITKPAVNQASFTTKDFKTIDFLLPPLKEQKQIAEILTAVDDKIDILEKKKTEIKDLKKGLMQQLLTGKIRVNIN